MSDEESDGDLWAAPAAEAGARRELRTARLVAAMSLILAAVSAVVTASVALRSPAGAQSPGHSAEVLGLGAKAQAPVLGLDAKGQAPGWYRTYLDAQVFATPSLSPVVKVLPVGSLVYVAEGGSRLVRLTRPVPGWMFALTEDGVEVLSLDETYTASPENMDLEAISRSREAREANERRQERAMRTTALQQETVDAMKRLGGAPGKAKGALRQRAAHAAQQVKRAPKTGERLAKQAVKALGGNEAVDAVARATREQGKRIATGGLVEALRQGAEKTVVGKAGA